MRVLQIGGGSMGSRRMRDLHGHLHLGTPIEVRLLDAREDRRAAAQARFGIAGYRNLDDALGYDPDVIVVSTPPDQHAGYVQMALDRGTHVFCEADIWSPDPEVVEAASARTGLLAAPSATLLFHPVIAEIRRIVAEELGCVHGLGYVLSVDGPSWHPGEGSEYYARHRATAPAREMTAFELIALQGIVGHASTVSGVVQRRGDLGTNIEDSYSLQYRTESGAAVQLTVLMASPQVARRGWVAGDHGFVFFDLHSGVVERQLPVLNLRDSRMICNFEKTLEDVYLAEISAFIAATQGDEIWPYSYRDSAKVCGTLAAAELSSLTGNAEPVRADLVPAVVPDGYLPTTFR